MTAEDDRLTPAYTARLGANPVPATTLPGGETAPQAAYRFIHDELMLDGSSRLNLATFVTTWVDPEAERLMAETFDKNMIDKDEYPQTAAMESRCVSMVADPVSRSRRRQGRHRGVHRRLQRGGDARRAGAEVAVAGPARRAGHHPAQARAGLQRAGGVGEVLPLLEFRAATVRLEAFLDELAGYLPGVDLKHVDW